MSFPGAVFYPPQQMQRIDTDVRRAVIRRLTDALFDYLTMDITEMEAAEVFRQQQVAEQPNFQVQALIDATENIETLKARIKQLRRNLDDVPEAMREVLNITVISPMEDQLRNAEQWQSKLQADIEKTDVPR